jgi:hypothetical protein
MHFSDTVRTVLLDIVGIVAILGGGSVVRVAQASGLTWQHVFPRLMPAPQAFIKDVRDERLPTERGTVVGVYNGNLRAELNFFASLLHPKKLKRYEVELVEVSKKESEDSVSKKNVYRARELGPLFVPSLLGLILSALMSYLSVHCGDRFALAATILLSLSSSLVGFASSWNLDLKENPPRKDREREVPQGDLVIYYARLGAFRVVKCDEKISELYFRIESCDYILQEEAAYRAAWLFATVLLMSGLICLRNSKPELQIAFAASYVLLNVLYWICSALNPTKWHWSHDYEVTTKKWLRSNSEDPSFGVVMEANMPTTTLPKDDSNQLEAQVPKPVKTRTLSFPFSRTRTTTEEPSPTRSEPEIKYTDALWTAIALVGHSKWVQQARIAPDNGPWRQWIEEAGNIAATWQVIKLDGQRQHQNVEASHESQEVLTAVIDTTGTVKLPAWDYQKRLTDLLAAQPLYEKRSPNWPELDKLNRAGYFPKTKAEAQPLQIPRLQALGKLPEAGKSQGVSTGVESTRAEPLKPSSSSTHLDVAGTRPRRGRSQDDPQRVSVAEGSEIDTRMTTDQFASVNKDKKS